jgi:hypothetical protein
MIGFKLDFWDYATFLVLFLSVAIVLVFLIWLAGLPGRIAIARQQSRRRGSKNRHVSG